MKQLSFKKCKCCICNVEMQVLYRTKTLRCWDCIVQSLEDYSKERNATSTHPHYIT